MRQEENADVSAWDERRVQRFIEENASAFRVFAERYVSDPDVVDDMLQEAYIKFWMNRGKIGKVASPRNYFFSLLKNLIADKRGYFARQSDGYDEDASARLPDEADIERHVMEVEASELITKAVMQLAPRGRQVILMELDGKSLDEIAKALELSVNTVKTVRYRMLKRLAELLSPDDFRMLLSMLGWFTYFMI